MMPFVSDPRSAFTVIVLSPGLATPVAIATCARGIASVCVIRPVAGSQSQ